MTVKAKSNDSPSAILSISCPDQPGIVAAVSDFLFERKGNIVDVDQHVDREAGVFFMRVEWEINGFAVPRGEIEKAIAPLVERFSMQSSLYFSDVRPRVALFVTKDNHCFYDLLSRHESGELPMDVPLIVSNREDLKPAADRFG